MDSLWGRDLWHGFRAKSERRYAGEVVDGVGFTNGASVIMIK